MSRNFGGRIVVRPAASPADWAVARRLIHEYVHDLGVDLWFQGFQAEMDALESIYGPPVGVLLLAEEAQALGCVGVRPVGGHTCEMKRLYVAPTARSRGVGRILAARALEEARALGYRRMLLDTLPSMRGAQALYASLGFAAIPAYRFNPIAGTVFMAAELSPIDRSDSCHSPMS